MKVIDFKRTFGTLYFPPRGRITGLQVPAMNFATVDGQGDPNTSPAFREALEVLYGVSYTAKFTLKRAGVADYRVGPLEALWSTGRAEKFNSKAPRERWRWTAMVMQPPPVTPAVFRKACAELKERRHPTGLSKLQFRRFKEGLSAQTLYVGPYSDEGSTIEQIHAFIRADGGHVVGRHHDIYLGDPRRTAPARLRTVLRQPYSTKV